MTVTGLPGEGEAGGLGMLKLAKLTLSDPYSMKTDSSGNRLIVFLLEELKWKIIWSSRDVFHVFKRAVSAFCSQIWPQDFVYHLLETQNAVQTP